MIKSRSKNEAKKQQILASATALFIDKGYAAISMASIASHADVSKQTVYSHFGSKEELFSAAISNRCKTALPFDQAFDFNDPFTTLMEVATNFFYMVTGPNTIAVHKICSFESKTYPQLAELFFKAGPERVTNEVAKILAQFHEKGTLNIPKPHTAATQFIHMVRGEGWLRAEFNTEYQLSEQEIATYIEDCVHFFIRGYAAT